MLVGIGRKEERVDRGGKGHDRPGEKNLAGLKMGDRREPEIETSRKKYTDEGEQVRRGDDAALFRGLRTVLD